jgi:hypothetical protein
MANRVVGAFASVLAETDARAMIRSTDSNATYWT